MFTSACATGPAAEAAQPAMTPIAPPAVMPLPPMAVPEELIIAPPSDSVVLRARYGAPDFVRREVNSELWRYDSETCMIFFFLYRDGADLKVRYAETTPRGSQMAVDPLCMQKLNARAGAMF